jgi:hypothetical protein
MKSTPIDQLFTLEKTKPVCFFYKLPEQIKKDYQQFYKEMLNDVDLMWIQEKHWVDHYMIDISPDKFNNYIMKYTDDVDYFTFYEYFEILQPTIETIINANNLYEEYPEYLI